LARVSSGMASVASAVPLTRPKFQPSPSRMSARVSSATESPAAVAARPPATSDPGPAPAALALAANLPEDTALSTNEKAMLGEWLDRIAHPTDP
jgi:hypothetical protein